MNTSKLAKPEELCVAYPWVKVLHFIIYPVYDYFYKK